MKLDIDLRFVRDNSRVDPKNSYIHIRSDAGVFLTGRVSGDADQLTGLSATMTARPIMPDGSVGAAAIVKVSSSTDEINITTNNAITRTVDVILEEGDTSGWDAGQRFVFDVEFKNTATPPLTQTVKGQFSLSEDYTINSPSPSPTPTP